MLQEAQIKEHFKNTHFKKRFMQISPTGRSTGCPEKNVILGIGWGYYFKKISNNPNFDMLSSFLELDFDIF